MPEAQDRQQDAVREEGTDNWDIEQGNEENQEARQPQQHEPNFYEEISNGTNEGDLPQRNQQESDFYQEIERSQGETDEPRPQPQRQQDTP